MSLQLSCLLALTLAFHSPQLGWSEEPAATAAQASLLFIHGDVTLRAQGGDWQAAQRGASLPVGTEVRVGPQAAAEIAYDRARTKISRLDKEGIAIIEEAGAQGVRVRLLQGRLFNMVAPLSAGEHFIVQTPSAVASVRGTVFDGEHDARTNESTFAVYDQGDATEHAVITQALDDYGNRIGEERIIREGHETDVREGVASAPEPMPMEKQEAAREILREVEERAEHIAPEAKATPGDVQDLPPSPNAPPAQEASAATEVLQPVVPAELVTVQSTIAPTEQFAASESTPELPLAAMRTVSLEELDRVMGVPAEDHAADRKGPNRERWSEVALLENHRQPEWREQDLAAMADVLGVQSNDLKTMSADDIIDRLAIQAGYELEPKQAKEQRVMQEKEAAGREPNRERWIDIPQTEADKERWETVRDAGGEAREAETSREAFLRDADMGQQQERTQERAERTGESQERMTERVAEMAERQTERAAQQAERQTEMAERYAERTAERIERREDNRDDAIDRSKRQEGNAKSVKLSDDD